MTAKPRWQHLSRNFRLGMISERATSAMISPITTALLRVNGFICLASTLWRQRFKLERLQRVIRDVLC